jgi:hypothetical protein
LEILLLIGYICSLSDLIAGNNLQRYEFNIKYWLLENYNLIHSFMGLLTIKLIPMKKFMFILAVVGLVLAASCTPEALTSDDQQIDKDKYEIPPNG